MTPAPDPTTPDDEIIAWYFKIDGYLNSLDVIWREIACRVLKLEITVDDIRRAMEEIEFYDQYIPRWKHDTWMDTLANGDPAKLVGVAERARIELWSDIQEAQR